MEFSPAAFPGHATGVPFSDVSWRHLPDDRGTGTGRMWADGARLGGPRGAVYTPRTRTSVDNGMADNAASFRRFYFYYCRRRRYYLLFFRSSFLQQHVAVHPYRTTITALVSRRVFIRFIFPFYFRLRPFQPGNRKNRDYFAIVFQNTCNTAFRVGNSTDTNRFTISRL